MSYKNAAAENMTTKQLLRKTSKTVLSKITADLAAKESHHVFLRLKEHPHYEKSSHICLYLPSIEVPKQEISLEVPSTKTRLPLVGNEINTIPILHDSFQRQKKCYIPIVLPGSSSMKMVRVHSKEDYESFKPNKFGIPEPLEDSIHTREELLEAYEKDPNANVLVIVPGLAFDSKGNRLGRGKGLYDKYLNSLFSIHQSNAEKRISPRTIAVAFSSQIVEDVPTSEHDVTMHEIITSSHHIVPGSYQKQ